MSSESLELEQLGELVRAALGSADLAAFSGRWQVLAVKSRQIIDIRGFDDRCTAALRAGVAE